MGLRLTAAAVTFTIQQSQTDVCASLGELHPPFFGSSPRVHTLVCSRASPGVAQHHLPPGFWGSLLLEVDLLRKSVPDTSASQGGEKAPVPRSGLDVTCELDPQTLPHCV